MKSNGESLRDLWDIKHTKIHIIGVLEGQEREGLRTYVKTLQLKTSPAWEKKQSPKSRKHSPI